MTIYPVIFLLFIFSALHAQEYYGTEIAQELKGDDYGVKGKVYIVDDRRFFIKSFSNDGRGPAAYFWIGKRSSKLNKDQTLANGERIPNELGSSGEKLRKYTNEDIVITLPIKYTIADVKYFSVWCETARVNFGDIEIPVDVKIPEPLGLGPFKGADASVVSAMGINLLNVKMVMIEKFNLNYTFAADSNVEIWLGKTFPITFANAKAGTLLKTLEKEHNNEDLKLELTDPDVLNDYKFIAITDKTNTVLANVEINFPTDHLLPPKNGGLDIPIMQLERSCKRVSDQVEISYWLNGDKLQVEIATALDNDDYVGFGVSGSMTSTQMQGGDIIATYWDSADAFAKDYYLKSLAFCSGNNNGVCPDNNGESSSNDAVIKSTDANDGIRKIVYERKLDTGDAEFDRKINKDSDVWFIYSIGKYNADKLITKHTKGNDGFKASLKTKTSDCTGKLVRDGVTTVAWKNDEIRNTEKFVVEIGGSGGERGYSAIAERAGWGIAFYINQKLIPILYLNVGTTYEFEIQGGDDAKKDSRYHPFYITDDDTGGIGKDIEDRGSKVYAGLDSNKKPIASTLGTFCIYNDGPKTNQFDTFQEYFKSLTLVCANSNSTAKKTGKMTFTPTAEMMGKPLFYQCYAHQNLGWKIVVSSSTINLSNSVSLIAVILLGFLKIYQ